MESGQLNPASLTPLAVSQLLSKVSGKVVTVSMIERDLAHGAPANPDGTIHLVHYGAWLIKELEGGDRSPPNATQ